MRRGRASGSSGGRLVLRAGAFTMASAELDYTIEIPDQPCRSQENSPNRGGKEAGTRQPLVILLGWGGCADKNLAKYSAIYHERTPQWAAQPDVLPAVELAQTSSLCCLDAACLGSRSLGGVCWTSSALPGLSPFLTRAAS